MPACNDRYVVLGVITGAHGIRGEVKLKSFTEEPQAVADYGALTTPDGRSLEIIALKPAKAGFIARLKGVSDRNAAEALKGAELRLPRERLPEPDEDEFYHEDLIGLTAWTADGEAFGEVVAIHDFGAGDLLEVRREGERKTELIPFTRAHVPEVNFAQGRIIVVPPESDESSHGGD